MAEAMPGTVLVTGGGGYVGALVVDELLAAGWSVRILDVLLHGQSDVVAELTGREVELVQGDVRDPDLRARGLAGADSVVHLAAVVGDPACALDPTLAESVNVDGARALIGDAARHGVQRFVFASTCSNYGRMADPEVPITEDGELAPVSLYARQKVQIERTLLESSFDGMLPTCLRFATVYGVAPRMRFDLTVNEFTRDLWADRELEVFGEQFWRPYIHVRDAARAVRTVLEAAPEGVAGEVFNAGNSSENYRKVDLIEQIRRQLARGRVTYVHRDDDPRDYKVSFEKIRERLDFVPRMDVPRGIAEVLEALDAGRFADPFAGAYRNVP
jgi:nucleoside-diphosphate-sugar epimerase